MSLTLSLLKSTLGAIHYSGLGRLVAPATRGVGVIYMLHHVRPASKRAFSPNGLLEITPEFLETVVLETRRAGYDIVSLDEAHARMTGAVADTGRPFACFTFDDGYRDNRDHAYPVLRRHNVPFTVYVASDFADHRGFLWWVVLEQVIAASTSVDVDLDGEVLSLSSDTTKEKWAAFDAIYWRLREMSERRARAIVAGLAREAGIDPLAPCRELAMTWDELRDFARDPLVTIGAHTVSHMALAKLGAAAAQAEIANSIERVRNELGVACDHFCYPYGDAGSAGEREFETTMRLGMRTAVTTRKGLIGRDHGAALTGLPRLSLNGNFQRACYLKALLSGLPFALMGARRRPTPVAPEAPVYSPAG